MMKTEESLEHVAAITVRAESEVWWGKAGALALTAEFLQSNLNSLSRENCEDKRMIQEMDCIHAKGKPVITKECR